MQGPRAFVGSDTVAINLYRPAWDDFQVTNVYGNPGAREALLGDARDLASWQPLLDERFLRRGAYLIPHEHFDWAADVATFVPDIEPSDDPNAWHPEDALMVPMRHTAGHLLGILSVDEPRSGRKPSDEELDVLVAVAEPAALAVEGAQAAADAARHRAALEQLLRVSSRLSETLDADEIFQSVCESVRDALGFQHVAVELVEPATGRLQAQAAVGWTLGDRAGATIGVIWADEPEDRLLPPRERLQALRLFANQAATAVALVDHVQELRFLADHDPLTRLPKRFAASSSASPPRWSRRPKARSTVCGRASAPPRIRTTPGIPRRSSTPPTRRSTRRSAPASSCGSLRKIASCRNTC